VKRKKVRHHLRWRCDSSKDYGHKLTADERNWLERFEDEYYRANFSHDEHQLHNEEQKRQVHSDHNSAWRDLVTQKPDLTPRTYAARYSADDYNQTQTPHPEEALVALLDLDEEVTDDTTRTAQQRLSRSA
jgi:hypothetical protein